MPRFAACRLKTQGCDGEPARAFWLPRMHCQTLKSLKWPNPNAVDETEARVAEWHQPTLNTEDDDESRRR